jgi:hypothetical protein
LSTSPARLVLATLAALAALALAAPGAAPAAEAPARVFLPLVAAPADPDLAALSDAAQGLLYPSESDAPLLPFAAPPSAASPASACAALAAGRPAQLGDAAAFLAGPARPQPWMSPAQLGAAARFAALRELFLARLADPVACRVGGVEADVFLLGVSSRGAVVGLRTLVVET